eukprot:5658619-Ditylum_brightwellii.AAC.1
MVDKSNFTTQAVKLSGSLKRLHWITLGHVGKMMYNPQNHCLVCLVNGAKAIDEVEAAAQEEEEDEQGNGRNSTST